MITFFSVTAYILMQVFSLIITNSTQLLLKNYKQLKKIEMCLKKPTKELETLLFPIDNIWKQNVYYEKKDTENLYIFELWVSENSKSAIEWKKFKQILEKKLVRNQEKREN